MAEERWTLQQLHRELDRWEEILKGRGYPDNTINTYVGRSRIFLRWLGGEWDPRGPNA